MRIQRHLVLILPILILLFGTSNSSGSMMYMYHPPRVIETPMTGPMWYADMEVFMYEYDTTGHWLIWQFEADELNDDPLVYTVFLDGEPMKGHKFAPWYDFTPIQVNIDGLAMGMHNFGIQVNDSHTIFNQALPYEHSFELEVVLDMPGDETTTAMDTNTDNNNQTVTEFQKANDYPVKTLGLAFVAFVVFLFSKGARLRVSLDL